MTLKDEPIGQRYLRTVTLALKFELGMGLALPAMYLGLLWLNTRLRMLSNGQAGFGVVVVWLASSYLLWESRSSAKVLSHVREQLVDEFYRPAPKPQ